MSSRGALYYVWGNLRPKLERSIASLKQWHPDLSIHVHELPADSSYLDKATMYEVSPFDTTLYLDCDTIVLGNLDYAFDAADRHGVACCINEVPWRRRYPSQSGDSIEYNCGVLFFDKIRSAEVMRYWQSIAGKIDSSCVFNAIDGSQKRQPCNDQAGFGQAMDDTGFNPHVLPLNWNYRPRYHRCFAGPIKIWHDYTDPPQSIIRLSAETANDTVIEAVHVEDEPAVQAGKKNLRVSCAMSVPRLGFMDNFFCWVKGLASLGIMPHTHTGVFWGQCLELTMEELLDSDYILTVDYDSVFVQKDVQQLLSLAANNPEVDAIVPIQQRRNFLTPLFTMQDSDGNTLKKVEGEVLGKELMQVATAHFGLTLIKVSALKKMPHPWFLAEPGKDGRWGEGHIDEDIYFWRKWAACGNSVHVANRVPIGHLESVVTWPDMEMKSLHQSTKDFQNVGKPLGVWQ